MPSRCCAALLLALLLAGPRPALAIGMWERGELSLEATGSQRLTGAFIHYYHPLSILGQEDDGLAASVTRLMLQGGLHRRLRYEVNLFVDLTRAPGAMQGGALATVSAFRSPYRNRHASWDFWETDTVTGQLGLDRLILTYSQDPVSVSLGRMPINHSVTQLFTPNDLFAPFSPAAIT